MLRNTQLYTKIGRICALLAKQLEVAPETALDIFYNSNTCELLHNEASLLFLMSDHYIVDDVMLELQRKQA